MTSPWKLYILPSNLLANFIINLSFRILSTHYLAKFYHPFIFCESPHYTKRGILYFLNFEYYLRGFCPLAQYRLLFFQYNIS